MATSDVQKMAVYDSRVVQTRPKFAVEKGALSVTNAPYQALSQTSSQHTYTVQVPSENTFCDRAVNWTSTMGLALTWTFPTPIPLVSDVAADKDAIRVPGLGEGWSWSAFPLQTCTNTIQATINDTSVTINTADVLKELLRLVDFSANRVQRTCPTKLDQLVSNLADKQLTNSTYAGFAQTTDRTDVPNGAYISSANTAGSPPYVSSAGALIPALSTSPSQQAGYVTAAGISGWNLTAANGTNYTIGFTATAGAPVLNVALGTDGAFYIKNVANSAALDNALVSSFTVYVSQTFCEKLVLPPFVFSDVHEKDVGLFGIQNIQWVMNMRDPQTAKVVRQISRSVTRDGPNGFSHSPYALSVAYGSTQGLNPYSNSRLDQQFLTPPLDLPLPPKSVVNYLEMPRYITTSTNVTIPANSVGQIQSQTITLPQIPDLIVMYIKPAPNSDLTLADYYLPIKSVNIQWDNYAGLLSTATTDQLYEISHNNGLLMDYDSWNGLAAVATPSAAYDATAPAEFTPVTRTVGGFLVIKPGKDYALATGQAPGLVGNYTFQANVTCYNSSVTAAVTPVLYVMTINSGLFESVKGTSRVVKGILSEADIISAPMLSGHPTRSALERAVGGAGFLSKLGTIVSKLPEVYSAVKPFIPLVKPHLPSAAQQALSTVGHGEGEGEGRHHKHKVSHRLKM